MKIVINKGFYKNIKNKIKKTIDTDKCMCHNNNRQLSVYRRYYMKDLLKSLPDSELRVMMVIWNNSEKMSTGEILSELKDEINWKLSTLQVILSRLTEKGFLKNEKIGRINYYSSIVDFSRYSRNETKNFIRKMYDNSSKKLIASLIEGDDSLTDDDIEEIKKILNRSK